MASLGGHTLPLHDRSALGALLQDLRPRMQAVALRITGDRDAAEDAVQSACEKAIRHGDRYRGDARVSTWLHRIVANEALMWLRRQKRGPLVRVAGDELDPEALADPAPDALDSLTERESLSRLRAGLRTLPRAERDVLSRCALAGWSYSRYGRERGLHPDAVKSRAFRARRHLRKKLGA